MADIVIDGIGKNFAGMVALDRIDLTVADGSFVALLGPSGCGKTTLLRIVAGLETPSAGRVLIGGRDVTGLPPRARGLAMVFQNYAVFPHLTVRRNIGFGLAMAGADKARIARQVDRTAELLHLEPLLERYPAQLSGGQRQRVAVARALAVEPQVLLMDEPLSNLDALLRLEMRAELKDLLAGVGTTTLYVTHDQTEAMGLADRIALMHGGRIEQLATPEEIYHHPATRFVGSFVGAPPMNFLELSVTDGQARLGPMRWPSKAARRTLLGIRPEDLVEAETGFAFTVKIAEPLGTTLLLTGAVEGGGLLRYAAPPDSAARAGSRLILRPRPGRERWMDAETGGAITE